MKILVVDDRDDNRYLLETLLKGHGHEVFSALNGAVAIEVIADNKPDLIISDILMPEMDGFQFCRKVKTDKNLLNIPFIFYTATYTGQEDELLAKKVGADSFITKPCDPEVLMAKIKELTEEVVSNERSFQEETTSDEEIFKLYNERLVRKLEQKVVEAENEIENRKKAEEELLVSRQRLIQAQKIAQMGDFILEIKSGEVSISDSLYEILKYEKVSKFDWLFFQEFIHHPDDRESISRWIDEAINNGKKELIPSEYRIICKDGEIKYIRTVGIIQYIDEKPERIFGTVIDITTYKMLENDLVKNVEKLQVAKQKLIDQTHWLLTLNSVSEEMARNNSIDSIFHVALEHLKDSFGFVMAGIAQSKPGNEKCSITALISKEDAICNNLGIYINYPCMMDEILIPEIALGEVINLKLSEINSSSLVDEVREFLEKLHDNNIKTITTVGIFQERKKKGFLFMMFRKELKHSDMEKHFLKGMVEYLSVAIQNRKLYEDLQESYYTLKQTQKTMMDQERMKAMGLMASGIAHDINNTLVPITLYTEALISSKVGRMDPAGRYLESIQNAVRDIEETVHRLRMFYKNDELENLSEIDIKKMIKNVIDMTRPRWKDLPNKKGIEINIETDIQSGLSPLYGNPTEIREALINLIFNAVDAMPEGGTINFNVVMDVTDSSEYVVFEVSDTGQGMTSEQKEHCLEPFYTSKGVKGSGLGLAMVSGMMQRHQGEMRIISCIGKGTTVRLMFPKELKPLGCGLNNNETKIINLPPLRILFIDDNERIRDVVKEMLSKHGHSIETFSEGEIAVNAFKKAKEEKKDFQVVITDLGMPHMDGEEIARLIKKIDPDVPVILLSGWGDFINDGKILPPNIDKLLSKPPTVDKLFSAISEIV